MPVGDPKSGEWWWRMNEMGQKVSCLITVSNIDAICGVVGLYDDWEESNVKSSWFPNTFLENFILDADHKVEELAAIKIGGYYWKYEETGKMRCKAVSMEKSHRVLFRYIDESTGYTLGDTHVSTVEAFLSEWTLV